MPLWKHPTCPELLKVFFKNHVFYDLFWKHLGVSESFWKSVWKTAWTCALASTTTGSSTNPWNHQNRLVTPADRETHGGLRRSNRTRSAEGGALIWALIFHWKSAGSARRPTGGLSAASIRESKNTDGHTTQGLLSPSACLCGGRRTGEEDQATPRQTHTFEACLHMCNICREWWCVISVGGERLRRLNPDTHGEKCRRFSHFSPLPKPLRPPQPPYVHISPLQKVVPYKYNINAAVFWGFLFSVRAQSRRKRAINLSVLVSLLQDSFTREGGVPPPLIWQASAQALMLLPTSKQRKRLGAVVLHKSARRSAASLNLACHEHSWKHWWGRFLRCDLTSSLAALV